MLSTEEFKGFAAGVVPYLHVTSMVEGEAHPQLLREKGGTGFPYVVAMEADGKVSATLDDRTVEGFGKMVEAGRERAARRAREDLSVKDLLDLVAFDLRMKNVGEAEGEATVAALRKREDLTNDDRIAFLRFDLSTGRLDPERARAAIAKMEGLTAAQKKDADVAVLEAEIRAIQKGARSPDAALEAGKTYAAMWKEGREPTSEDAVQPFFIYMLGHAEAEKDAALFERALDRLKDRFGDLPQAAPFFQKQNERLAKLKEAVATPPSGEDSGE